MSEAQFRVKGFDQLLDFFLIDLVGNDFFFLGSFPSPFLTLSGCLGQGLIPPLAMPFLWTFGLVSMRSRGVGAG